MPLPFTITHHGATTGVTGSCHQLTLPDGQAVLVDCGLFQGAETAADGASNSQLEINFPIDKVRALVVTHVHIDHVGRIPYLIAAGFRGPILCSEASAALLPLVLEDALKVGFTKNQGLIDQFLKLVAQQIVPLPYKHWHRAIAGVHGLRVKLQPAGHILGSAYVECEIGQPRQRIVFSGDLGAPYTPLLPAPKAPYSADVLVLESTYGDSTHQSRKDRRARLQALVERALKNHGTVLIPAFSIGRTQELLYELEEIIHRQKLAVAKQSGAAASGQMAAGKAVTAGAVTNDEHDQLNQPEATGKAMKAAAGLVWDDLDIIIDSPLAADFTAGYAKLRDHWDAEAKAKLATGRHPLAFEQLTTISSHTDHLKNVAMLAKSGKAAIVIAASGMCSGGRIVNYLAAMLGDARHDVLFVGYQAAGTPGQAIQKYGPKGGYVELDGQRITIRAAVHTLGGYSAHADQKDLLNFVGRMRHKPRQIRLVHGDAGAKEALRKLLSGLYPGMEVVVG